MSTEPICCLRAQRRKLLTIAGGNLIFAPMAWLLSKHIRGWGSWEFWVESAGFLAFMSIPLFVKIWRAEQAEMSDGRKP